MVISYSALAQVVVSLKFNKTAKAPFSNALFYQDDFSEFGLDLLETERTVKAPGNVLVKVKRINHSAAFDVWVDSNLNGKFDEKSLILQNNSEIKVTINRKTKNGGLVKLPYVISYERLENKGKVRDHFYWSSHYRASGIFKKGTCSNDISLLDFNADGIFDEKDAQATNLQIDRNGDKKIWGKEEYARTNEIVELCGEGYLISEIDSDGAALTFQPTVLKIAKIGEIVPEFSVITVAGQRISSGNLKGKNYLLDFWASWCVPCVENLPQVKKLSEEFGGDLKIVSINVDKSARAKFVQEIIKRNVLTEDVVIRGLGDSDPLWKIFGSANRNSLAIPLYVLVDVNGIVRYADSGGKDLTELREKIKTVILKTNL